MAIDTYDQLIAQIPVWAERTDLSVDLIRNFIYMAEADCSHMLRVPSMEYNVLLPVVNSRVVIPADYIELRALTWQGGSVQNTFQYLPWDQFVMVDNRTEGQPQFFSRQGNTWYLNGDPGDDSLVLCNYYGFISDLSPNNQQNWLLSLSPMVYLYGALKYLYEFTMDNDRSAYWNERFITEINKLQLIADNAEHSGTSLAIRNY